ncbi:conserved hypothetical protein [Verrucomicrobiia bacterium DG1235]|nr:conserved hypothetical protein [Verrucomicrobiae bacterium DG1235]
MPDKPSQTKKPPRFRRAKRVALAAIVLLALAVLAFPVWSVWLAKPLARSLTGIELETVTATSWDRWLIQGLTLDNPSLTLRAENLQLPSPSKLVLQHLSSSTPHQSVVVENWLLNTKPSSNPTDQPQSAPSLKSIISLANKSLTQLSRYLAQVELKEGNIRINEQNTLSISEATLSPTLLSASLTYLPKNLPATLAIDFTDPDSWKLTAQADSLQLATQLYLLASSDSISLNGSVTTNSNPVSLTASWTDDQTSFLPANAEIHSENFTLDQRYPFWGDAPSMNVNASANWKDQRFEYRITGFDTNHDPESPLVLLAGGGTLDRVEIGTAKVELPWLAMENDQPIILDFSLQNPLANAQLEAKLDLERLPFVEATGKLDATLQTTTTDTGLPVISTSLHGTNVTLFDTTIASLDAQLDLLGQNATLHSLQLRSSAGSILSATGSYDLTQKTLSPTHLQLELKNESQRLQALLPNIAWQSVTAELDLEGPIQDPSLTGSLTTNSLQLPKLQPFTLAAEIEGRPSNLRSRLHASNETEQLHLELHSQQDANTLTLAINELTLSSLEDSPVLALEQPFTARIQKTETNFELNELVITGANAMQIAVDSLSLSPENLVLNASAIDFNPSILNHWLLTPLPNINIQDLDTRATLSTSDSQISSSGSASWALSESSSVDASWLVNSDPNNQDSLIIDHLDIGADSKHILVAEGRFPISINWAQGSLNTLVHKTAPLSFTLQSSPHPDFWSSLDELLPIALTRPVVNAQLAGTLDQPEGNFELQLTSIIWRHPENPAKNLALSDIKASLLANTGSLAIRSLEASAGANQIKADASLPLGEVSLLDLIQRKQPLDLELLTGHASLALNDLETLKAWLPPIMRYDGKVRIDAEMQPGDLTATAFIEDLATRPMPPLGALSKVTGKLRFEDGVWHAEQLTGLAEKSPFTLSGTADLTDISQPALDIAFSSKEFPIVRDSGLLLTGDIDLQLVSTQQAQTTLRGDVRLTKGLFLVEPDLLASQTKTTRSRPPYFSVEQEPFNEWGLDIAIRGDKFLRVSNSFFEGTLSAEFDLEGTLGSPLLIGKAEADSGRVFFPASSLKLTRGQALITRDRPSELQIDAAAEGRLFAYDVNLNVTGPSEKLDLSVTTNPALTQVDALLLLTTGAVPNAQGDLAQKSATTLGIFIGKGLFRKLTGGNSDAASKLDLEVGKDISLQGKKTIEASYELTETLEIEGEYDKRDEFNANLKWTIFKR